MAFNISGTMRTAVQVATVAKQRYTDKDTRQQNPVFYFDDFCVDWAVGMLDLVPEAYSSMNKLMNAITDKIVQAHTDLDVLKLAWKGRTGAGYYRLSSVALAQQAAIKSMIGGGGIAPGHDRGVHATNPVLNGAGTVREYDLTAGHDGRMTVRTLHGKKGYYYSRHHAAATYEYLLLTDGNGRAYMRGTGIADAGPATVYMKLPDP